MLRIHQFCFLMPLIFLNQVFAEIGPPMEFGKAIDVKVIDNGQVRGMVARNERGSVWSAVVNEKGYYVTSYGKPSYVGNDKGVVSNNTIPAEFRKRVSKREVISKVFQHGKGIGGKVLLRGLPYVGQAALAWDLVNAVATEHNYEWSDDYRNWVKPSDNTVRYMMRTSDPIAFNANNIWTHRHIENWCNKRSSSGGSRDCSLPQLTTATGEQFAKMVLSMCGSSKITVHGGGKPKTEVVTADRLDPHRYCARGIYIVKILNFSYAS